MRRFGLALVALGALEACSLFFDTGSLQSGNGDSSNDAGTDDSGAGNLLVNGGFEEGTAACGPGWSPTTGTMQRSTDAHSGSFSCELCPAGSAGSLTTTPDPKFSLGSSTALYAEVYVKVEGTATSVVVLDVEELVSAGSTLVNQKLTTLGAGWHLINANAYKPKDGGTGVTFDIQDQGIDGGTPSCILIDDARLLVQ